MDDLEEGWTAHKAPTGHTYYYNASTKKSTYKKPTRPEDPVSNPPDPSATRNSPQRFDENSPKPGNTAVEQTTEVTDHLKQLPGGTTSEKPSLKPVSKHLQYQAISRQKEKKDRPKYRSEISTAIPWQQIRTKEGRTFYHNPDTLDSHWTVPAEIATALEQWLHEQTIKPERAPEQILALAGAEDEYPQSDNLSQSASDDQEPEQEVGELEFNEDDIAWQLAAMEEAGEGPINNHDDTGPEFTSEEKDSIFTKMLEDCQVDPYRTWESELEKIVSDPRYLILDNTHQRKIVFEKYCTEKAKQIQQAKAALIKEDPKAAFLKLVKQSHKKTIYFQDFKRKYKKEAVYQAFGNSDHEREKLFRSFSDLTKLSSGEQEAKFLELIKSSISEIKTDPRYHILADEHAQSLLARYGRTI